MRVAIFHKWNNIHVGYTYIYILQFELGEYIWEMVSQCEKVRYLGWYNLPWNDPSCVTGYISPIAIDLAFSLIFCLPISKILVNSCQWFKQTAPCQMYMYRYERQVGKSLAQINWENVHTRFTGIPLQRLERIGQINRYRTLLHIFWRTRTWILLTHFTSLNH